ncbi:hypothetical protein H9L19_00915 [Weissella diestrammenae]|uniref:Uncharacterized protein n=1 Tax=Weissella diestrammenae TaxID=1162633 RepID=A0A7G9T5X4_9LACO|nr:hypothetical protein [Weissella diestrammenae]MCM0582329.1 hypothetical protein [Weissella diestrammenae]QNN75499.1 hypothetical protein H9L19_00915 [Weissella diestrammenae]
MAYTKSEIQTWIKQLQLDTWGPVEVNWTDDIHRVHVIAGDHQADIVRAQIEAATQREIDARTTNPNDAQDFLTHLFVTDYAQED